MNQPHHSKVIKNAPFGYAYHKIILDDKGKPVDYEFLEVNPAFEKLTGLKAENIINRKVTEAIPGINKEGDFDWIGYYGDIALSKGEKEFEQYFKPLKKWYRVNAYSIEKHCFTTVFTDITKEKLIATTSKHFLQYTGEEPDYQKICNDLLSITNAKYIALNIADDKGKDFTTVAISGISKHIRKASDILGFELVGKKWKHDPVRVEKIKKKQITRFKRISDLTGDVFPKRTISLIEDFFRAGEIAVVKTMKDERVLGDFTVIMHEGETLKNESLWEIYAQQIGLFIEKLSIEKKFIEESQLRKQLLDNIPGYLALVLKKDTHEIVASNKAAISIGALPGKTCFGTSAMRNDPCPFCLADEMWKTGEAQSIETEYRGRWYEGYWAPLSGDLYMHYIRDITEIKKAKEAIKANEKFLSDVFDSIQDGISVVDKELNILRVNNTINKWYSNKLPLEGRKCHEAFRDRIETCDDCPATRTLKTGKLEVKEVSKKHDDGSHRTLEVYAFPMTDDKGNIRGVIEYVRDITKGKEAEKALRESEEKYRDLIENIDSIFWKFDIVNNRWTFVSPQTREILGYEPEEWTDYDFWLDRLHEDDREWASEYCRECVGKGISHEFEYRFRKKDGSYAWLYDEVKVVMEDGRPAGMWGILRDVTERKQAEETLRTYEKIFLNTNDMLAIIGFDGYFKDANPTWYKYTGRSRKELLSKPFLKFIHKDDKRLTINSFQNACKGEKIVFFENRFLCKDETERWFLWDFIPYSKDNFIIGVARDNTNSVVLEKEKDIFNRALIERVKELTFLNNISKFVYNSQFKLPELFKQIASLMPHAFQYSEKTFVEISGSGINLTTQGFRKTNFFIAETVASESYGNIEITIYADFEKSENTKMFYNEKFKLLNTVSEILANYISRIEAIEKEKHSEQRFVELFNNVNDIVFTADVAGNILNANAELERQLGYKLQTGLNIFTFITPYSARSVKEQMLKNFKTKTKKAFFDVDFFTIKDKVRTCEVRLNIKYKNNKVDEMFGIARDVTELRKTQNLLMRTIIDTEEKEKMHFAEELHDGIGPLLSGINMYIEKIQSQETISQEDRKLLKYCYELVNDAIDQIRIISNDLMPRLLNKYGLSSSINSYIAKINPIGKVKITIAGDTIEARDIPHEAAIIVYRGIAELINNTLKHSGAKNITIGLQKTGESLVIKYSDDGRGVSVKKLHPSSKHAGLGIRNLISRTRSLNGTVHFADEKQKGFSVQITIPVKPG